MKVSGQTRSIISIAFLIFCMHFMQAQSLLVTPLSGRAFVYTTYNMYGGSPFPSNSMYLVTDDGVILFDTPWDSTQFQPLLDSIWHRHQQRVVLCIATHYHADRTAGFDYYRQQEIKTFSSKQTRDLCKQFNEKESEFVFMNDTAFTVGGISFQTYYPGEGHTPDNIVIWVPSEKIIYGGCLVKSTDATTLGNIADANLQAWPQTIRNVKSQFPDPLFIIPGHFGWEDDNSLDHTLKLLKKNKN